MRKMAAYLESLGINLKYSPEIGLFLDYLNKYTRLGVNYVGATRPDAQISNFAFPVLEYRMYQSFGYIISCGK